MRGYEYVPHTIEVLYSTDKEPTSTSSNEMGKELVCITQYLEVRSHLLNY
jgi:hypothetical protein